MASAPPILDFSGKPCIIPSPCFLTLIYSVFYGTDDAAKAKLVAEVKKCCLHNGFFQIVGHRVPLELQEKVLDWVKKFFAQPQEEKDRVHKGDTSINTLCIGFD